jgi:putative transposase
VLNKHSKEKGKTPMNMEIAVTEAFDIINEIRREPENLFAMIREDIQATVGQDLSALMEAELTHFLGRGRHERCEEETNHRNGSYGRNFILKGIRKPVSKSLEIARGSSPQALFLEVNSTRNP